MKNSTALIILDMFNTFDFPEGKALAKRALPIAKKIEKFKRRCRKNKIPVIYVNDNFGKWNLEPLLAELKVNRLILTGIAGDICVLFTAHDAHMRNYDLIIPKDCIASNTARADRYLLYQLETTLKFKTTESKRINFGHT
jgi:nicotinamidase-related amidase